MIKILKILKCFFKAFNSSIWFYTALSIFESICSNFLNVYKNQQVNISEFLKDLKGGYISSIIYTSSDDFHYNVYGINYYFHSCQEITRRIFDDLFLNFEDIDITYKDGGIFFILNSISLLFIVMFFVKKIIERIDDSLEDLKRDPNAVTFDDIIGLRSVKEEIVEVLSLYTNGTSVVLKSKKPKGVLFFGAPGNGKTMMAKAIANQIDGEFFYLSASELDEIYVGTGSQKIRNVFGAAKQHKHSVIFIDELDVISGDRRNKRSSDNATLNQLLVEMDGIDTNENILVIGATNLKDDFDPALKRRFEVQIDFDNPSVEEIREMLKYLLKDILHQDLNIPYIASGLSDISRADLVSIVENAKRIASLDNRTFLISNDLEEASLRQSMGRISDRLILPKNEKWKTSYHEAGHAFMFYYYYEKKVFLNPPRYLTVVPRSYALGFVMPPSSDSYSSHSVNYINGDMQVCYAGLCCEEIFQGRENVSIGCSSDLKMARKMAENYVNFGLDEELGCVGIVSDNNRISSRELNDKFSRIRILCEHNLKETMRILQEKKHIVEKLAIAAYHLSYLTGEQIENIIVNTNLKLDYSLSVIKKRSIKFVN